MKTALPHLIVRASAGTGKTFQLTNRIIRLLAQGEKPESILATTFTRKAAGEIFSRVFKRLASGALDERDAKKLALETEIGSLSQKRCKELLSLLVRNQHRLSICTMDSFSIRLARSFAFELGLSPSFVILETHERERILEEAVSDLLSSAPADQLAEAYRLFSGGALVSSVHASIQKNIGPLLDLFSRAEKEVWGAIAEGVLLPEGALVSAYNALAKIPLPLTKTTGKPNVSFQKEFQRCLEIVKTGALRDLLERGLVKNILEGKETYYNAGLAPDFVRGFNPFIQHVHALVIKGLRESSSSAYELLSLLSVHYTEQRDALSGLFFSDVKNYLARQTRFGGMDHLYYRLDCRIHHLLLDEFQDTSPDEWAVIKPLAAEVLSQGAGERSFFCVGDPKQAIYAWRGGAAEVFDSIGTQWSHIEHAPLVKSYRSSPVIMKFVDEVLIESTSNPLFEKDSALQKGAALFARRFSAHEAALESMPGYVQLASAPDEEESGEGSVYRYAAIRIKEIVAQSPEASVGVLVRSNKALSHMLYELKRHPVAVEASGEGGLSLTESPSVCAILALLTLIDHPEDTISLYHVNHTPLRERFLENGRSVRENMKHLRRSLAEHGYGPLVREMINVLVSEGDARELSRLSHLALLASRYGPKTTLRTTDFVRFIQASSVEVPSSAKVRVMTIHKSKGLEFDVVVLPELDSKLVTPARSPVMIEQNDPLSVPSLITVRPRTSEFVLEPRFQAIKEAEQERSLLDSLCVLYVALTRAKHALYLFIPPTSFKKSKKDEGLRERREENLPLTFDGYLRGGLKIGSPVEAQRILLERGDRDWFRKVNWVKGAKEVLLDPPQIVFKSSGPQKVRGIPRVSPSSFEGTGQKSVAEIFKNGPTRKFLFGKLIHGYFKHITWLPSGILDKDMMVRRARREGITEVEAERGYGEFLQILSQPGVNSILLEPNDGAVRIVKNEWPFVVREKNTLLSGTFDRVVIAVKNKKITSCEIIDFKTDLIKEEKGGIKERVEYYRPQIAAYKRALETLLCLDSSAIHCKLVFLRSDEIVSL